ncbi:MAG: PQQ-dependent sugar dehydrogenase [Thermoanaerobaculia bacterium]
MTRTCEPRTRPSAWAWFWAAATLLTPLALPANAQITTSRIASGLSSPTYVVAPPCDFNRIFVTQLGGSILIYDLTTESFNPTPFLTLSGVSGEGLQGLAFHPNYAANGYFYVYHFSSSPARTRVRRFTRDANDPDLADASTELTILEIPQLAGNHNGGSINFGPDGYLYLPLGDGGPQCDPSGQAQDTTTLLGSVLRLDVDRDDFPADADKNYGIPPGNPFVGQAGLDEIWSYGVRNPFRSSFDRATGDFYIADVGQGAWEEINYRSAANTGGDNYGWNIREGFTVSAGASCAPGPEPPGNVNPLYAYAHGSGNSQGNSVTGGNVYRGPETDNSIQGRYFFGDYVNERIWSIDAVTGANFFDWTSTFNHSPAEWTIDEIVGFGEDGFGNVYIVDLGGEVFRIEGPVGFVPCPNEVFENDAVMGTEIFEHCRVMETGPNFFVGAGGDLTLRAGTKVILKNGTTIAGNLTIEIDDTLQGTPP